MIIITILFSRVWFPADQSNKIAKRYIDWLKDNPPDKTIETNVRIGFLSDENGNVLAVSMADVVKGKEKEALFNVTKQNVFLAAGVENLKYKSELILDFQEGYKILNMTAPEV
ncbi:MAG: hypothetical protein ACFE9S_07895 [Candidatus Hermodarchaeota archaeon]